MALITNQPIGDRVAAAFQSNRWHFRKALPGIPARCAVCNSELPAGEHYWYSFAAGLRFCVGCYEKGRKS